MKANLQFWGSLPAVTTTAPAPGAVATGSYQHTVGSRTGNQGYGNCNTLVQQLVLKAGANVVLNFTKQEYDTMQGTCFDSCVLPKGATIKFDGAADYAAKYNILSTCLKGNKAKYCTGPVQDSCAFETQWLEEEIQALSGTTLKEQL